MSAPETDKAAISQTIQALLAAGYNLLDVDDHEECEDVATEEAAVKAITSVGDAFLIVEKGGQKSWVRFVLGNEPHYVICDHTADLAPVLGPLTDRWFE